MKSKKHSELTPWVAIQVVDGTPVQAYIDNTTDNRVGPMRIRLLGGKDLPPELTVYISESYKVVTKENATWSFNRHKTGLTIYPADQQNLVKTENGIDTRK